jgi:hypothetical protein
MIFMIVTEFCISILLGLLFGAGYAIAFERCKSYLFYNPQCPDVTPKKRSFFVFLSAARLMLLACFFYFVLHWPITNRILILVSFLFGFWLVILKIKNGGHGKS